VESTLLVLLVVMLVVSLGLILLCEDAKIKVKYGPRAFPIAKATDGSAGYDMCASEDVVIPPGTYRMIPTGVYVQLPRFSVGDLVHRSGMNSKQGAWVYGTIDSDFRGDVKINMFNMDPSEEIRIKRGEAVAQLVVKELHQGSLRVVDKLKETKRGTNGFGSTGRNGGLRDSRCL